MTRPQPFNATLANLPLAIAMRDPDPSERAAKIEILRKDGWVQGEAKCA